MSSKLTMHANVDDFLPASEEEKRYMVQMRPSSTFFKDGMKRLLRNRVATVSLIIIVIITLSSIFIAAPTAFLVMGRTIREEEESAAA